MTSLTRGPTSGKKTWSWRPRFGLSSLVALVTLAAVGSWYWWRLPFEVEHKVNRSLGKEWTILWVEWPPNTPVVDPVVDPGDPFLVDADRAKAIQLQVFPKQTPRAINQRRFIAREVETVRRLWGGKTIRDGSVVGYDEKGRKISEAHYREGTLHGQQSTWFRDGHVREQGEYRGGKKEGPWVRFSQRVERDPLRIELARSVTTWTEGMPHGEWEWFDPSGTRIGACKFEMGRLIGDPPPAFERGLAQRLAEGAIADRALVLALVEPSGDVEFVATPLKDAIDFLAERHEVPLVLDAKSLEESGVNIDTLVPLLIAEGLPLVETLSQMLGPTKLVGDYRHGMLMITTPKRFAAADGSGVSLIKIPAGSPLAGIWKQQVSVEFVETPFSHVLGFLEKQVGIQRLFAIEDLPGPWQAAP